MYRDILFALAKMNSLHLPNAAKALLRIANTDVRSPAERHVAMSWAQRLKRVFNIDIELEVCDRCGGSVKVIACIEDQDVIDSILAHLREKEQRRNKAALPYRTWCHPPEHPLGHYLFSQDANPQPQISKDATEKRVARTVACYRSGMNKYELCDHLSEQLFRAIGGYFANFSGSVSRISEETYSQQAVYLSYTPVLL